MQAFNSRPSWTQSSPSAQQTCERAILGLFHPPPPPAPLTTLPHLWPPPDELSPSIVPFSHSLAPPASSLGFLPNGTVCSSLSCFSTSVPRQAECVSAVYPKDEQVSVTTADTPSQGQTGLRPHTKAKLTNSFSFSTPASAVEFRLVPVLTHLLMPIGTFMLFCSFPTRRVFLRVTLCVLSDPSTNISHLT